jgi:hypothetical protein
VFAMFFRDRRFGIRNIGAHVLALTDIAVNLRDKEHGQRTVLATELSSYFGKVNIRIIPTFHTEAVDLETGVDYRANRGMSGWVTLLDDVASKNTHLNYPRYTAPRALTKGASVSVSNRHCLTYCRTCFMSTVAHR